jgi:hypothetical protein
MRVSTSPSELTVVGRPLEVSDAENSSIAVSSSKAGAKWGVFSGLKPAHTLASIQPPCRNRLTGFGMILQPRAVASRVVEDYIGQAEKAKLVLCDLEHLLDELESTVLWNLAVVEELRVIDVLACNRVGASAISTLLQRGVMKHGVATRSSLLEVCTPCRERAHPLADDREDTDSIERKVDGLVEKLSLGRRRNDTGSDHGLAGFGAQDGVDVEVTLTTLDTFALLVTVVFDPVAECTSVRDGKVDLDGLAEVGRQSSQMWR